MAGDIFLEGAGEVERLRAGLDIPEAAIDGQQFGAQAEHADVDALASLLAQAILGGGHNPAGESAALVRGIESARWAPVATSRIFRVLNSEPLWLVP